MSRPGGHVQPTAIESGTAQILVQMNDHSRRVQSLHCHLCPQWIHRPITHRGENTKSPDPGIDPPLPTNPTNHKPTHQTTHTNTHKPCLGLVCPLANNFPGSVQPANASRRKIITTHFQSSTTKHRKSDNTTTVAMPTRTSKTRKLYVIISSR